MIPFTKDPNCLCVVAERVTKIFSIVALVNIALLRAEFEILAQIFS